MNSGEFIRAEVAGTFVWPREDRVKKYCKRGMSVTLRREPDNKFDRNAILVEIPVPQLFGLYEAERDIGYIEADVAADLAPQIDFGIRFECEVERIDHGYQVVVIYRAREASMTEAQMALMSEIFGLMWVLVKTALVVAPLFGFAWLIWVFFS